ncbi:Amidohydro-rel domain-containing protein [Fusarium falciforme]|uniref:Amidohydro-rel domain-containing protein n=1 Tax=Fusarium falciforme TaxID=195108 RepID=UPI0023006954|nr:Amidohydro-rel domain-containing protein [Fusarium falciforme]WAO82872.1 Amidohydro-rel domain-containing protein [Fusarium falciforme]
MSYLGRKFQSSRIDTHIHVIPPSYLKALNENGGDPSGWPTPSWTREECIRFSDTVGSSFSVLSITAPGPALLGPTPAGRELTRSVNDEVWEICQSSEGRFGFFASLPDFNDIEGTLAEIDDIFMAKKRANGVIVMSSYGDKLVGDDAFKSIWKRLNDHKALIFVHPGHVRIIPESIAGFLPQPVIDYPQATTRAALSIVLSGIFTECQNINVILSHGGGTLPYLGARAVGSLLHPAIKSKAAVSMLQANQALSRFHYDLALATSTPQLKALEAFADPQRVLWGSDFPYAPKMGIYAGLLAYAKYTKWESNCKINASQLHENARGLLEKHRQENSFLPSQGVEENPTHEFGIDESEDAKKALEELSKYS